MHHWEPEEVVEWWVRVEDEEGVEDALETALTGAEDWDEEAEAEEADVVEDWLEADDVWARDEEVVIGREELATACALVAARYSAGWITLWTVNHCPSTNFDQYTNGLVRHRR